MALLKRRTPRHGRRGNAMVEMALVLPVLVMFIFGIIEYGWMFYCSAQINLAARGGVRAAVRPQATDAEVRTEIAKIMNGSGWQENDEYTVTIVDLVSEVGEPVTVSLSVDYKKIGFGLLPSKPPLKFTPTHVGGTATMAKEGEE